MSNSLHLDFHEELDAFVDGAGSEKEHEKVVSALAEREDLADEERRLRRLGDLLLQARVEVKAGFLEEVLAGLRSQEREHQCVGALLQSEQVEVRPGFADQVMAAAGSSPSASRWTRWGLACAAFLAIGSALLFSATEGGAGMGLLGTLSEFASMTLLAGAGLVGATWAGIGVTVDSWLGASVMNWSVALLVTVGLVFLCARSVRRRRVTIRKD